MSLSGGLSGGLTTGLNGLGGASPGAAVPPTPLPSDLIGLLWWATSAGGRFDATSGGSPVTADGASIASWAPVAGSVTDRATQPTSGSRPKYDAVKGLVIADTAAVRYFVPPAGLSIDRGAHSIFFVVELVTLTGLNTYRLLLGDGAGGYQPGTKRPGKLGAYIGGDQFLDVYPLCPTRVLIGFVSTGTTFTVYINGAASPVSQSMSGSYTPTGLFSDAAGSFPCEGGYADVVVYDHAVSGSDVTTTLLPWAESRGVALTFENYITCCVDSITVGVGATLNRGWTSVMTLGASAALRVSATSGATAADTYAVRATNLLPLVEAGKTNVLVIWGGTNDIAGGSLAAAVYVTLTDFVTWAKGTAGYDFVILVTPLPRSEATISGQYAALRTLILLNTARADAVADPTGNATLMAGWNNGSPRTDADGIHPNNLGYSIIAPIIKAEIEGLL